MIGWIGDFFRFWWALFYWNARKTWFHLRGAERDSCPCQNYGDSGLAFDSRCDAVIPWNQPRRFRRVCPLLHETPEGWRCSVDAERVRPFWGRAAAYAGGSLLALYLAGTLAVFGALRLTGYDVHFLSLLWPPRWSEVRGSQERLYARRAQQAMTAGNYQEAILALEMVCQLNPRNYPAGLALASLSRVAARPFYSENVYERLMRDVPEQRPQTAQLWLRTLLASAAYNKIKPLAATMLLEDPSQRSAWLHALLFAARATADAPGLTLVLEKGEALPGWCRDLLTTERALLLNQPAEALPRLTHFRRLTESNYVPYYQVDRLLRHDHPGEAQQLLKAYGDRIAPDEAGFMLLRLYHASAQRALFDTEAGKLLSYPLAARGVAQFCAYLIGHPDPALFARFFEKFTREGPLLATETLPLYQAAFLAAGLAGDREHAELVGAQISRFTGTDPRVLRGLAELIQTGQPDARVAHILPLVPLPTEVLYAVLERSQAPAKK